MTAQDPRHIVELAVARCVYEELRQLSPFERDRVMTWVEIRLASDGGDKLAVGGVVRTSALAT